ncbi:MAG TPA: hypothetical protein VHM70_28285 [Polyangiaceae bacterium]|jgi:hypothetical protein|nr:hypothetical protein [Polyangiaceae bacterium]
MRGHSRRFVITLAALLGLIVQPVRAEDDQSPPNAAGVPATPVESLAAPPKRLQLRFSAPEQCPQAAAFTSGVSAQTPAVSWDSASEALVSVEIEPTATRGVIRILGTSEQPLERVVEAADCTELLEVLEFVLVVAIDPAAGERPREPRVAEEPKPQPPPEPRAAVAAIPRRPLALIPPASRDLLWALSVRVSGDTGLSADVRPGIDVGVDSWYLGASELEGRAWRGKGFPIAWAPELGLELGWLRSQISKGDVSLVADRWAARVNGCPVWIGLSSRLLLAPCLEYQVGWVATTASGLEANNPTAVLWSSLGARLALSSRWSRLWATLDFGAYLNLKPHSFSFIEAQGSDRTELFGTPRWGALASLTLAFPLWRSLF